MDQDHIPALLPQAIAAVEVTVHSDGRADRDLLRSTMTRCIGDSHDEAVHVASTEVDSDSKLGFDFLSCRGCVHTRTESPLIVALRKTLNPKR